MRLGPLVRTLCQLPSLALVAAVRLYQGLLSPLLGPQCRFRPTCSEYFIEAVQKYGLLRGTLRGVARICRCHPLGGWGDDPP